MSDVHIPPTQKELESVTFEEFIEHLTRCKVTVACRECGAKDVSINTCDNNGTLAIIETPVMHNNYQDVAYQYFTATCGRCGSARIFNAIVAHREIVKARNKK